jgi:murein DD-endopeptidase MepM/ murein hydrolase activator NlpD
MTEETPDALAHDAGRPAGAPDAEPPAGAPDAGQPAGALDAGQPPRPPRQRDRGQLVATGAMGALLLLGLVLIVRGPRTPALPAAPAVLTSGAMAAAHAGPTDAGAPSGEPLAVTVPIVTHDADAGPRFVPAWRVASLRSEPGVDIVEGHYGKLKLEAVLAQAGVPRSEVKRVARAFDGNRRVERPGPKDSYVLAKERAKGTVLAFEHVVGPSDIWQARVDEASADKRLAVKKLELFVEHKRVSTSLAISADLGKAVAAAGLRDGAVDAIDDALEGHVDLTTLRHGVRLRVIADEEWVEGAFARFRVDAIELAPKGGPAQRVYFYQRDAHGEGSRRRAPHPGYYDAKGQQPYKGAFRSPLPLARVTSRFNPKRMHPVLHVVMPHNGIDFGASSGTPVYASAPGTVASAGDGGPCGNMIQIDHAGGLTTAYCHLSRFAPGLHAGQKVEAKQLVGYVGQTGRATGPHLHFAVKRGGVFIDPFALKMDGVRVLPPSDRDVFAKKRAELDVLLEAIPLPVTGADAGAAGADDKDDKDEDPSGEE